MSEEIIEKEQEIYENYVEKMLAIVQCDISEIDSLKLVGAFIKDQKLSALPKRRKPAKSIRDEAMEDAKLPFIRKMESA